MLRIDQLQKLSKMLKSKLLLNSCNEKPFQHYKTSEKFLFNNETNFLKNVIKHYLRILVFKHKNTISYHSKTTRKFENLNKTINNSLIQYLMNKLTKL